MLSHVFTTMPCALQSTLGRARTSMVQWLLECLGPACASTTRAKAVKALGEVVQADTHVLDSSAVQTAVDRALQVRAGLPRSELDMSCCL